MLHGDIIVLNFIEPVTLACCTWALRDHIDICVYISDTGTIEFRKGLASLAIIPHRYCAVHLAVKMKALKCKPSAQFD